MNRLVSTIALLLFAVSFAQAETYETYAFGNTGAEACKEAETDLNDQARLQCRMNGGQLAKTIIGKCHLEKSSGKRIKALRSVRYSCKKD